MIIETILAPAGCYFTPAQSNAYYAARYSREGCTIHWWGGGEAASQHDNIVKYFLQQGAQRVKSVNFVVSDLKVTCMVPDENVAWCSQAGNPTTISIEFQPTLGDQGYKNGGELIASLEKKYGHKMNLYPHSKWYATGCPGTIDIARLRSEADAAAGNHTVPVPVQAATPAPAVPQASANTVHLPQSAGPWRAYREGSSYRPNTSDQVGTLRPDLTAGGLTYAVLGLSGNVAIIQTRDFGRVAIWIKDTPAELTSAAVQAQPVSTGKTVTFPSSAGTWAVYKPDSGYRKGTSDQVGTLQPGLLGSLTYPVVEQRSNVVIIDTRDYGRVAAWTAGTEAIFN